MYALLSGLNAATVGIIALAAVQLSQKAITDKITSILVFLGATAGMLYNALWYFPLLMFLGGTAATVWDYRWGHKVFRRLRRNTEAIDRDHEAADNSVELNEGVSSNVPGSRNRARSTHSEQNSGGDHANLPTENEDRTVPAWIEMRVLSWRLGITVIACFFVIFMIIMIIRGTLMHRPRGFNLFANLFLAGIYSHRMVLLQRKVTLPAGTIIFGGGPVVIPLLRE